MSQIKLFGYSTSPFVRKIGCCLYYKNLPFEFVPVSPPDPKEISFTNQTQVPVLEIDGEWRKDSTPLALWLDELFPERPLFGRTSDEKEKILEIDQWVSESMILSGFRSVFEAPINAKFRHRAWRLAAIVSSQTPLSDEIRNIWPDSLQTAPFIKHMMQCVDSSESLSDLRARVGMEMLEHFKEGPYFGGLSEPSLLDFAILPQVTFDYMVGITDQLAINEIPVMAKWIESVMQ
ncbi:MAG: glutathione S-transferase family protein, partial [Pseudomonadales bacterium]